MNRYDLFNPRIAELCNHLHRNRQLIIDSVDNPALFATWLEYFHPSALDWLDGFSQQVELLLIQLRPQAPSTLYQELVDILKLPHHWSKLHAFLLTYPSLGNLLTIFLQQQFIHRYHDLASLADMTEAIDRWYKNCLGLLIKHLTPEFQTIAKQYLDEACKPLFDLLTSTLTESQFASEVTKAQRQLEEQLHKLVVNNPAAINYNKNYL